jgi:hypothetical protein
MQAGGRRITAAHFRGFAPRRIEQSELLSNSHVEATVFCWNYQSCHS